MNKQKINKFKLKLAEEYEKLKSFNDQDIILKLESFGTMYADWFAKEKALRDINTHGVRYLAMIDIIEQYFPIESNINVAEIGCNTAFLSIFFKQKFKNSNVVALDLSSKQIEVNKIIDGNVFKSGIEHIQADASALRNSIKENSMDLVFLCEILEHFVYMSDTQIDTLKNALSITKPDGKIVVSVPYEDRIPSPGHKTNFTREMLDKLFSAADVKSSIDLDDARVSYGLERHFLFLITK